MTDMPEDNGVEPQTEERAPRAEENLLVRLLPTGRVLILSGVGVLLVLGAILIITAIGDEESSDPDKRVNALANSDNECVDCHRRTTPGIVEQYGYSTMAAAEVLCEECHVVSEDYPGAIDHFDTFVLNQPTTAKCETCHNAETSQFLASRHGIPAYVAMVGLEGLNADQLAMFEAIPEAVGINPNDERNALFELEGPAVTYFACEGCHNIGRPAADGSVGQCQSCHLSHTFSLEQARRPETCNACHIGPDHPQWEIFLESPHGIAYMIDGDNWNWDAEPGTLTVSDFPAPTCATCHISGFGAIGTSHDVGSRLTWYLFQPISERRPAWQDNLVEMQTICTECHNPNFVDEFYTRGDELVYAINDWVVESNEIFLPLREDGLISPQPFDETIEFEHFNLWHHWGRTAKFGSWMQGPDYTQWHGAYEVLHSMAELREMADAIRAEAEAAADVVAEASAELEEDTGAPLAESSSEGGT
ncbi:MAG: nitrate reductase [Chloroflexi bacterium]|nr:nitrate reductase [Chloroflexota bacterium]